MAKTKKTKKTETTKVAEETVDQVTQEETTQEEGPQPIGQLFNTINYNNMDDLNSFISNMTPDQGLYILVQATRAAQTRGAYGMEETETLSKAIRTLTNPSSQPQEATGEPEVKTEE
jgi:hypothetical protein